MLKKAISAAMLLTAFSVLLSPPSSADEVAKDQEATPAGTGTLSLAEMAPELYYQLRRYPKFYGDPNTQVGGFMDRTHLLGSLGGVRDDMVDHGIYLDASVSQFLQANSTGGRRNGDARWNGSADYWLTLDSGKAGLWSGGAIFVHAESSWEADRSINRDTGSLIPGNFDATMPKPGESIGMTLPELYLVQALPANMLILAGKVNWAGLADTSYFANNERTQFMYTGLTNNPILGAFVPYTSLGVGIVGSDTEKRHTVALIGLQKNGKSTSSGFDNFNGEFTVGAQYQFSPKINDNLPGNYRAIVGATNKDLVAFDIDPRHLIAQIVGVVPVKTKPENYAFLLNFDQYLWVKDSSFVTGRKHQPPVGIGLFGRAGWSPEDRNVIDQFYSFGIGGYGMLIPGRDMDQWGLGWAGTHISGDLRRNVGFFGVDLDSFEHAVEAFYNFNVTPALHLTVNAQAINSTVARVDTAYTFGTRLQIDF